MVGVTAAHCQMETGKKKKWNSIDKACLLRRAPCWDKACYIGQFLSKGVCLYAILNTHTSSQSEVFRPKSAIYVCIRTPIV